MESVIEQINKLVKQLTEKPINQLRLEEELLISLAQNTNQPLKVKALALKRVARINQLQLELLGSGLQSKTPKLS